MHSQWLKTEHDRLHIVEMWPDSPQKEAALTAIRSKLASLSHSAPAHATSLVCEACLNGARNRGTLTLRMHPQLREPSTEVAA